MEKICFPIFFRGHDFMWPPTQRSSTEPQHLKSTKFDLPPHDSHKMTPCFSIDVWGVVQKLISLVTPLIGWGGINQGTPKYSWCSAKKFPSTTYSWKCPPRSLGGRFFSGEGSLWWFNEEKHDSHRFWRKDASYFCVHPRKLTWNLKMSPWKRRFLLKTIIFRFHVSFRGCKLWQFEKD